MKTPFLVTNKYNLEYLINFTGSNGFLLMTKSKNYFFTDSRYIELTKALKKKGNNKIKFEIKLLDKNLKQVISKIISKHKIKKLYFEVEDLTILKLNSFKKTFQKVAFSPTEYEIASKIRIVKNKIEIQKLQKAQNIIEKVFKQIKIELKVGQTEKELAWKIKELCQKYGADNVSFEPIVAFNKHSAIPHHQNTTKKLKKGDLILIDSGAKLKGYCSDMTRIIFTKTPTKKEKEIYNIVLEAQIAAIKTIKTGVKASLIAKIARDIMKKYNYNQYFTHSLGHGVGIEVHDPPTHLSVNSKDILKEGMVITIEPGIYLSNQFGIRIEDMGVVTKTGIKLFTKTPKKIESCIKEL